MWDGDICQDLLADAHTSRSKPTVWDSDSMVRIMLIGFLMVPSPLCGMVIVLWRGVPLRSQSLQFQAHRVGWRHGGLKTSLEEGFSLVLSPPRGMETSPQR